MGPTWPHIIKQLDRDEKRFLVEQVQLMPPTAMLSRCNSLYKAL